MYTLEEIKEQLALAGVTDLFGTAKEVKALPEELQQDETIKYATSGIVDGNTFLIVCTNKRVLFLDKGLIYGLKKVIIPLEKINSISFKKGLVFGEIEVQHGSEQTSVKNISKPTVGKMAETIQKAIDEFKNSSSHASSTTNTTDSKTTDNYDKLIKLKELLDLDIISKEEFEEKKKEILGL